MLIDDIYPSLGTRIWKNINSILLVDFMLDLNGTVGSSFAQISELVLSTNVNYLVDIKQSESDFFLQYELLFIARIPI